MKKTTLAHVMGKAPRRRPDDVYIKWVDPKQLIGIEIEAERIADHDGNWLTNLPAGESLIPMWSIHNDGSLLNGTEYVLSRPMSGGELSSAIHMFFKEAKLFRALTSGTHIHVDMHDEDTSASTPQTLYVLVYAIEPALFGVIDPGREWCGYTNPLQSAPPDIAASLLADNVESDPEKMVRAFHRGREMKYYGLNFQPLSSYGSVEFRYFPTAESAEELVYWVNMVQAIIRTAKNLDTKEDAMALIRDQYRYEEFMRLVFGEAAERALEIVPHGKAVHRCNQAMFTRSAAGATKKPFPPEAAKGKRFGRFFKSAVERYDQLKEVLGKGPEITINLNSSAGALARQLSQDVAAGARQMRNGDLLFASDGGYIWIGSWTSLTDHGDILYHLRNREGAARDEIIRALQQEERLRELFADAVNGSINPLRDNERRAARWTTYTRSAQRVLNEMGIATQPTPPPLSYAEIAEAARLSMRTQAPTRRVTIPRTSTDDAPDRAGEFDPSL